MELCTGRSLWEVIADGELAKRPEWIWKLFRQVLEAVASAHAVGGWF